MPRASRKNLVVDSGLEELIESLSINNERVPQIRGRRGRQRHRLCVSSSAAADRERSVYPERIFEKLKSMCGCSPAARLDSSSASRRPALYYELPEFGVAHRLPADRIHPGELSRFNRVLVSRAVRLLDLQPPASASPISSAGWEFFACRSRSRGAQGHRLPEGTGGLGRARALKRQRQWLDDSVRNRGPVQEHPSVTSFGPFDKLLIDPPREGVGGAW